MTTRSTIALALLTWTTLAAGGSTAEAQTSSGVVIVPAPSATPAPVITPQPQPTVYVTPGYAPAYGAQVAERPRRSGPNLGLVISGAVLLGVGWISNFLVGLGAGTDPFRSSSDPAWGDFRGFSFIPIAGPWIQLATKPTSFGHDSWGAWLIIDGILQGAGTALLIAAIATAFGDGDDTADRGGVQWALAPMLSPSTAGLSVLGSF